MKQYLLAVHDTGTNPYADDAEMQEAFAAVDAFNKELMASGAWVFAGGLQPADTATTVRLQDGRTLVTDGPFSETKEQLGGFWIIKAADLDEVLPIAERAAVACKNPVEVRPFQDEPES
jgi:hypothetical protein